MASPKPIKCWNCGEALVGVPLPISRHAHCASCFEGLRCCRFCQHYRELDHAKCAEDRADPPVIKENANFCEFFRLNRNAFNPKSTEASGAAKSKLDALFGGEEGEQAECNVEPSTPAAKPSALDDLFDD